MSNDLGRLLNQTDKLSQQRKDQYISSELFILAAADDRGEILVPQHVVFGPSGRILFRHEAEMDWNELLRRLEADPPRPRYVGISSLAVEVEGATPMRARLEAEAGGRSYAIAVMVEHGLHGSSGAGPVLKGVIDYIYTTAPERFEFLLARGDTGLVFTALPAEPGVAATTSPAKDGAPGLLTVLGLALLGGLILNLMPSVFPLLFLTAAGAMEAAGDRAVLRRHGLLYTAGAVVYATKKPDPSPRWFGYHEVFHAFTIAAWLAFYVGIAVSLARV